MPRMGLGCGQQAGALDARAGTTHAGCVPIFPGAEARDRLDAAVRAAALHNARARLNGPNKPGRSKMAKRSRALEMPPCGQIPKLVGPQGLDTSKRAILSPTAMMLMP